MRGSRVDVRKLLRRKEERNKPVLDEEGKFEVLSRPSPTLVGFEGGKER